MNVGKKTSHTSASSSLAPLRPQQAPWGGSSEPPLILSFLLQSQETVCESGKVGTSAFLHVPCGPVSGNSVPPVGKGREEAGGREKSVRKRKNATGEARARGTRDALGRASLLRKCVSGARSHAGNRDADPTPRGGVAQRGSPPLIHQKRVDGLGLGHPGCLLT